MEYLNASVYRSSVHLAVYVSEDSGDEDLDENENVNGYENASASNNEDNDESIDDNVSIATSQNEEAIGPELPLCRVCLSEINVNEQRWIVVPCGHAYLCTVCKHVLMNEDLFKL